MDRGEVERLIAVGEGAGIEFKLRVPAPLRLARSICGFANSMGGVILAGVDDDGRIVGVDSAEETTRAFETCLDMIDPRPEIRIEAVTVGGTPIVVCRIVPGDRKPYQVMTERGAETYIRAGASIRPVSHGQRLADEDILRRRLKLSPLQEALLGTIGRDEGIVVGQLAARHNLSRHRTMRLLVPLLKAGVIVEKDGGYMLRM